MNTDRPAYTTHKKDEGSKVSNPENLPLRIKGLEQAKTYPGMTTADIAALDRLIVKLKAKLEEKEGSKTQQDEGL